METWICDNQTEEIIKNALCEIEENLAMIFQSSPNTHEERITGFFIKELQNYFSTFEEQLTTLFKKRFDKDVFVTCTYEDIAANGPEKIWGADIGFYLKIDIPDYLIAERGILVQVKKAILNSKNDAESRWDIDFKQLLVLINNSHFSVYFFIGLSDSELFIRVLPASYVWDISNSYNPPKRSIPARNIDCMSPKFSDFFLKDFLGNWWGDQTRGVIDVIKGNNDIYGVKKIIKIEISDKEGNYDRNNRSKSKDDCSSC